MSRRSVVACAGLSLAVAAGAAQARKRIPHFHNIPQRFGFSQPDFSLLGPPVGGPQAPAKTVRAASLQGNTIAALDDGALVIDADSGELIRINGDEEVTDRLAIGRGAGQLVVDGAQRVAYVADRRGDRIAVVSLETGLEQGPSLETRAEPFGLALTPDGSTLLVTTVADRHLSALARDGTEVWAMEVGREPRGVAISPDGSQALVTFLTTGAVARIDLLGQLGLPTMTFMGIDPAVRQAQPSDLSKPTKPDQGRSFARNAFAAIYVGNDVAVVPHQVSTPHLVGERLESRGTYGGGGGFNPPIAHRLSFLSLPKKGAARTASAATRLHQPRAVAYDPGTDALFVAGYGSDDILSVHDVSQASVRRGWHRPGLGTTAACGPTGLAVTGDGNLLVHCSLTRNVVRLDVQPGNGTPSVVRRSKELSESTLTASQQRGRALFREGGNPRMSTGGAMACASCHAEARTDGLSWRIEGHNLQTPLLAGRLVGTHPFKWDGQDRNLQTSLRQTVRRLGGTGLTVSQARDLRAFLTSLEPPRSPTPHSAGAVERGRALFDSDLTGCVGCHNGPHLTDGRRHALAEDLERVDTPSLLGLATSAPYYHDGSARTLRALLLDNGTIHGMGRTSKLDDHQISDLVAYLESL